MKRYHSLLLVFGLVTLTACQAQVVTQIVEVTKEVPVVAQFTQIVEMAASESDMNREAGAFAEPQALATGAPPVVAADSGQDEIPGTPSPLTFSAPGSGLVLRTPSWGWWCKMWIAL